MRSPASVRVLWDGPGLTATRPVRPRFPRRVGSVNRTNVTGLSVTDSQVTWYDLVKQPIPPPGGGARRQLAGVGRWALERAPQRQRRGAPGQSGRSTSEIRAPASGVEGGGSGRGSAGDPRGIQRGTEGIRVGFGGIRAFGDAEKAWVSGGSCRTTLPLYNIN